MDLSFTLYKLSTLLRDESDSLVSTTSELAGRLGVSQQTMSRHLINLEQSGCITRERAGRGFRIRLTPDGVKLLKAIRTSLDSFFCNDLQLSGEIASGLEEGAYYIKLYSERITEITGFKPYPGTLNIKLTAGLPELKKYSRHVIEEFEAQGRRCGRSYLIPATIKLGKKKIHVFIILPERTHHEDILEVIHAENLRKKYGLRDNDETMVEINC